MKQTRYLVLSALILFLYRTAPVWAEPIPAHSEVVADQAFLTTQHWEVLLAVGAPAPLNLGVSRRVNSKTEFAVTGGYLTFGMGSGRRVSTWNVDLATRWHPFDAKGSSHFYLGIAARYLRLTLNLPVSLDSTIGSVADSSLTVGGFYVVPAVGWTWELSSSLSLGVEVGLQVAVLTDGNASSNGDGLASDGPAMIDSLSRNSVRAASYYSRFPLPNLTLFRLGWKI